MKTKPKLAIFDLGNVLFGVNWELVFKYWSKASGIPVEVIKERFSLDETHDRFERKEITAGEFHQHVNSLIGADLSFEDFCNGWNEIYEDVNKEVCDLLPRLKSEMKVVAFTNTNPIHSTVWPKRYATELKHFDSIFVSSEIGLRKPDHAGFQFVLEKMEIAPEESIFFDDLKSNVDAAIELGIQGVVVDRPSRVKEAFEEFGL